MNPQARNFGWFLISLLIASASLPSATQAQPQDRVALLLEAAQRVEISTVQKLLKEGVDANSKSRYGATALSFACDKGSLALVELLLASGADLNVKDTFYQVTPLGWAFYHLDKGGDYKAIALLLLRRGAEIGDLFCQHRIVIQCILQAGQYFFFEPEFSLAFSISLEDIIRFQCTDHNPVLAKQVADFKQQVSRRQKTPVGAATQLIEALFPCSED